MDDEQPDNDLVRRFDELRAEVAAIRADIHAMHGRANEATDRATASDDRADSQDTRMDTLEARATDSNHRASASEDRATAQGRRIDKLEARIDLDRALIAELQVDGVLSREHAAHLEEALSSSRRIGAAIGIVMAELKVSEAGAFEILSKASQDANRKLRLLADEVVLTGDVSGLPSV